MRTSLAFLILLVGLTLTQSRLSGQKVRTLINEAMATKPKVFVGLDGRRSLLEGRTVRLLGVKLGLDFNHRVRTGITYHFLTTDVEKSFIQTNALGQSDTIQSSLEFGYLSWKFEYIFFSKKRWQFSVPLYMGIGSASFSDLEETEGGVLLSELSLQGHFKIFPWLGLGGGIGYRYLWIRDTNIDDNLNGLVYMTYIKFFAGVIYKKLFKKDHYKQDLSKAAGRPRGTY